MNWYSPNATRCVGTKFDAQFAIGVNFNSGDYIKVYWNEAQGGPAEIGHYDEALNITVANWAYRKVACNCGDNAGGGDATFTVKHFNSSNTVLEECTSPTLKLANWDAPTPASTFGMEFDVQLSSLVLNKSGAIRVYTIEGGVPTTLIGTQAVAAGQTSATVPCLAEGETGDNVLLGAYYYPSAGTVLFLRQATVNIYALHWVYPAKGSVHEGLSFTAQIAGIEGALENDELVITAGPGPGGEREVGSTTLVAGQATAEVEVTGLEVTDARFVVTHGTKLAYIPLTIITEEDLPSTPYPGGFSRGPAFDYQYGYGYVFRSGRASIGGTDFVIVALNSNSGLGYSFMLYDIANEYWFAVEGPAIPPGVGIFGAGDDIHIWTVDTSNFTNQNWISPSDSAEQLIFKKYAIDPNAGTATLVTTKNVFVEGRESNVPWDISNGLFTQFLQRDGKLYAFVKYRRDLTSYIATMLISWDLTEQPDRTTFITEWVSTDAGTIGVRIPEPSTDGYYWRLGEVMPWLNLSDFRSLRYVLPWLNLSDFMVIMGNTGSTPISVGEDGTVAKLSDTIYFPTLPIGGFGLDERTGLVHIDTLGNIQYGQYGFPETNRQGVGASIRWALGDDGFVVSNPLMPQFSMRETTYYYQTEYGTQWSTTFYAYYSYLSGNPLVAVGMADDVISGEYVYQYVWKFDPHPVVTGLMASGNAAGYVASWVYRDPDGYEQSQYRLKLMDGSIVVHDTQWVDSALSSHTQTGLPAGTYTLKLWVRNNSGRETGLTNGPWTASVVTGEDTTNLPPVPTITAPTAGQVIIGTLSIAVSATDDHGLSHAALYLDGNMIQEWTLGGLGTTTWSTTSSLDTAPLGDSQHTLSLTVTDNHGSSATATRVFTTDNHGGGGTPPTITFNAPTAGSNVTGSLTIDVTVADAEDGVSTLVVLAGSQGFNYSYPNTPASVTNTSSVVDTTKLPNGPLTITAFASNPNGLMGTATITVNVANGGVTGNPPTISLTAPAEPDYSAPIPVELEAGDAEGIASIYVIVEGNGAPSWSIANVPGTTFSATINIDFSGYDAGSYTVTATITDTDGNVATDSVAFYVDVPHPIPHVVSSADVEHYNELVGPESIPVPTDASWVVWPGTEVDKLSERGGNGVSVYPKGTPYLPVTMFDFDVSSMFSWQAEQKDEGGAATAFDPRKKNSGLRRLLFTCTCNCMDGEDPGLVRLFVWDVVESRWRHFNYGNPAVLADQPEDAALDLNAANINLSRFVGIGPNETHIRFAVVPKRTMPVGDYLVNFDFADLQVETDMRICGGRSEVTRTGTYYLCFDTGRVIREVPDLPTGATYRQTPGVTVTLSTGEAVEITNVNVAYATITVPEAGVLHWMAFGW